MDQVDYTLLCERIIALIGGVAFLALCCILGFTDPSQTQLFLALFLVNLYLLLFAVTSMVGFWWVFSIKKQILDIDQVNKLLFRSGTISLIGILILVLNFTSSLNLLGLFSIILALVSYLIWL
ncbi:MAG: hypothetical protein WCK98_05570 [bacterium]